MNILVKFRDNPTLAPALAVLLTVACGQDFAPPSLIDKFRVIGVRAEPPEIRLTMPSRLEMLTVGQPPAAQLCYAWAFCPFAWSKDGNFACIDSDVQVDMGVGATATVGLSHVVAALQNASKVFDKLGLKPPTGAATANQKPDLGCFAGGVAPASGSGGFGSFGGADISDMYVLFQVGDVAAYGGTCPTSTAAMLAKPCSDRGRCIAGYKRLAIVPFTNSCPPFDAATDKACAKTADVCPQYLVCGCDGLNYVNDCARIAAKVSKKNEGRCQNVNENPKLQGIGLRLAAVDTAASVAKGVDWPADLTPVVAQGAALQLWPRFDPKDKQVIGPSQDVRVNKPETEVLAFSWFADAGSLQRDRSFDDLPESGFIAPMLAAGQSEKIVNIWLVVRDGRNGTDWLHRRLVVANHANAGTNPLCALGAPCQGP